MKKVISIVTMLLCVSLLSACATSPSGHTGKQNGPVSVGNISSQADVVRNQISQAGVGVEQSGNNIELVMPHDVTFATGSAVIQPRFYPLLDAVALALKYDGYMIRVAGDTDSVGSAQSNQVLSDQRADAVRQYLWERGISPTRLSEIGYGEAKPIATNKTSQGRSVNRRVEINLYEPM